ncbi:MAG: glycosyltransferase family 2 protein [Rubripirellula sp.]
MDSDSLHDDGAAAKLRVSGAKLSTVDFSVVVPLYNESESVPELLRRLDETLGPLHEQAMQGLDHAHEGVTDRKVREQGMTCEIVLVDDGSRDSTYQVARHHGELVSVPVQIVSLQRNFGQTAAMQAGIDHSAGEMIATMDGDLQNDPADLPMMVDQFRERGLDLLCGRRKKRQDGMLLRLIPSWIANRLIAKVTGVKISDNGCSLKVYRGSIIKQVRLMGEMHRFIPAWVSQVTHPSNIGEVDVRHHARQFGQSKYGISRTIRVVLDLMAVLFFMRFRARPGHFFGVVGMAIGSIGMFMLGSLLIAKYGFGEDIGTRPMLIVGALAMLSSVQFICFGIMAEMLTRIYHESGNRTTYVVRNTSSHHHAADSGVNKSLMMKKAG